MTDDSGALDPNRPITPQVFQHLRARIIRNDLQPGHRISETEIARSFGVSRQPVREAFIKLAEQGLVAVLPQRGTVVTRIALASVHDARFLREAIEADVVAILASCPDPAALRELRGLIRAQRRVSRADYAQFNTLDEAFHRTLAEAAGKGGAWRLLEGLKSQMDRVRYLSLARFPAMRLVDQHETLVDRIEASDVPGAALAIRTHLREILTDLPEICLARPDVFDLPSGSPPEALNAPLGPAAQGAAAEPSRPSA